MVVNTDFDISIHPPRAGRDYGAASTIGGGDSDFNPPAPCGAGRWNPPVFRAFITYFNPPAPCGAGHTRAICFPSQQDFNPPAPCGAGLPGLHQVIRQVTISIHPPRAGRDFNALFAQVCIFQFQSTRPVRGGTTIPSVPVMYWALFQSTRPVRGGTCAQYCSRHACGISIHPPRAGRDPQSRP